VEKKDKKGRSFFSFLNSRNLGQSLNLHPYSITTQHVQPNLSQESLLYEPESYRSPAHFSTSSGSQEFYARPNTETNRRNQVSTPYTICTCSLADAACRSRSILADLQTASHLGGSPPSPYKTLAVSISKRLDAAQTFRSSTPPRTDLADQYEEEVEILKEFAPKKPEPMSKDQLEEVVKEVMKMCELTKVEGKDTGRVIKLVMERVGERAEGKDISSAVKRIGSA